MKSKNVLKDAGVLLIVAMMCITAFAVFPTVNADCPDGMISYWKLDETVAGPVVDSYGSNDGTNYGAMINQPGQVETAYEFDGNNDYIDITQLSQLENANELTVACWIYKHTLGRVQGFVGKWYKSPYTNDNSFLLYNSEGANVDQCRFVVNFADDTGGFVIGTTKLPINQWHFIVGVWRNTDGFLGLYINGKLDNSKTGVGVGKTLKYHTQYPAKIGHWGDLSLPGPDYYMDGLIDEVAVYDRALHASEVLNHYNAGLDNRGYCDLEFMGLGVAPLGDAMLDIGDDMRVWNLDDDGDGDDGVKVDLEDRYKQYTCKLDNPFQSNDASISGKFTGTYNGEAFMMSIFIGSGFQRKSGKGIYPVGFEGTASGAPSIIAWNGPDIVYYKTFEDLGPMGTITEVRDKGIYPVGFEGTASGAPSIIVFPTHPEGWRWVWPDENVDLMITALMIRMENSNEPNDGSLRDFSITATGMEEFTTLEQYAYENDPPNTPNINGPTSGTAGTEYPYTISAIDPDGDDLYYFIDWGDNSDIVCIGPYESGVTATASHTWSADGTYTIKARAMNTWGMMSEWGELTVTMPRNRAINSPLFLQFLQNFLESHPNLFPILRILLQRSGL